MDWGRKRLVDFNAGKTQLVYLDCSKNTDAIDVIIAGSVPKKKTYFKILGLTLYSKLDMGSYIISIPKTLEENWSLDSFYEVSFS